MLGLNSVSMLHPGRNILDLTLLFQIRLFLALNLVNALRKSKSLFRYLNISKTHPRSRLFRYSVGVKLGSWFTCLDRG